MSLIQALFQNGLDRFIAGIFEVQRPLAGGFQTRRSVILSQTDDTLGGAQIVQNPVGKESPDQLMAVRTDCLRLAQTPLGILKLVSDRLRRHGLLHGSNFRDLDVQE